jgi:hypothetical protein
LRNNLDAKALGGSFNPELHDLVERIDHSRQKSDLDFLCFVCGVGDGRVGADARSIQRDRRRHQG